LKKVPWLLIVGDQEKREGTVNPRDCAGKTYGSVTVEAFADRLLEEATKH
jgi:threonyl-tRNA synthetase